MKSSAAVSSRSAHTGLAGLVVLPALLASIAFAGCAGGGGEGDIFGQVSVPTCGVDNSEYELTPNFFSQENWENTAAIRVQRGSDFEDVSNGITVLVDDVEEVSARLGEPITVGTDDSPVQMAFRLGDRCWEGRREPSVVLAATSGTITFEALHVDGSTPETTATFDSVRFEDDIEEMSTATLSGYFSFLFARGRPGQRFP